ncbi:MAG: hypothetical protein JXA15_10730 [Spirochaetales bacterium]|nr:hypothetical protein [Spirochaetales bacterium]
MEILKRRPAAFRRLRILALAALALAGATCKVDWLYVSYGPEWLTQVRAGFDLDDAMEDAIGAAWAEPRRVERYVQNGQERVFVFAETERGPALAVLDGETMEALKIFPPATGPFNDLMFQDASGQVVVGQVGIDSSLNAYNVAFTYSLAEMRPLYGFGFQYGTDYWILQPDPDFLRYYKSLDLITAPSPATAVDYSTPGTFDNAKVPDLEYLSTAFGEGYYVATVLWSSGSANAQVRFFPGLAPPNPLDSASFMLSYWPSRDDSAAWLTRDGFIRLDYDYDDDSKALVRQALDGSGAELDTFRIEDTEDQRFFFDPDGRHWYVFDRWYGRLYLLETWWPK